MRYLSVCSGIEAATAAWHPLGWIPVAFSEIEPFPCALLAHHYPGVPNWGDMTRYQEWPDAAVDVLVGGTPCQSFSVAGLRGGMADPRGNLALVYLAIADRYRPEWLVWENVPGVLSSGGGRDFGAFLGALVELGYGFAYRVLDAQHFGLAQRRKRVFVVANSRDWRRAAAVLFEPASLRVDPAPRREKGEGVANSLVDRPDRGGGNSEGQRLLTTHTLRAEGFDASEDGTGRGIPLTVGALTVGAHNVGGLNGQDAYTGRIIPVQVADSLRTRRPGEGGIAGDDTHLVLSPALNTKSGGNHAPDTNAYVPVGFAQNQRDEVRMMDVAGALAAEPGAKQQTYAFHNRQDPDVSGDITHPLCAKDNGMGVGVGVRRLTPKECERLQGFPDDYTLIHYRGKPACDGPRYKALGNSMAVPCMAWIGRRIAMTTSAAVPRAAAGPCVRTDLTTAGRPGAALTYQPEDV